MKNIVVLGAGLAAPILIRQLMRATVLPQNGFKLFVVSPNTHLHFTLAIPRLIVPGQMSDDQAIVDLRPQFNQYPAQKFEWLVGRATALEPQSNTVTVSLLDGGERKLSYDVIVIATGASSTDGMPWRIIDDTETTKKELNRVQKSIKEAKTIIVAGGGLTGTEAAAELGYEYARNGSKEVYFVYADSLPLDPSLLDSVRRASQVELKKLKVRLIPNSRVTNTTVSGSETTVEIRHKDGTTKTLTAQAYIPALGHKPNSSFVPTDMLDEHNQIKQTKYLRAEGYDNIFVVGDVGNMEISRAMAAETQMAHVIKALPMYLQGSKVPEYKPNPKSVYAITLGRSRGTGQMGTWKLPSLMVWWAKGRNMGTPSVPDFVAGKRSMMNKYE